MHYRSDIDGLRGLAVASVVLYHAGVPGFSGGFVGVDVFFVISGYLITSLIWPEIEQGRFSILAFYERRARRILPALFVVLAVSAAFAYRLFLNSDLQDFSNSLIATVAFVSNLHFLADIGYFAAPAETKPLLHTWSLAIEEQFYILFPLLLLLLNKYREQALTRGLALLALVSFALGAMLVRKEPDATFYLPHTRAWELLLGALLALGALPRIADTRIANAIAASGVAMILASVFLFDRSTPFPGVSALLPCVGTLFFIWSNTHTKTWLHRLFRLRAVVGVGLVSYSWYLWHWPALVFAKYYLVRPLTPLETGAAILGSLLLAVVSWRYVERPFRGKTSLMSRAEVFRGAVVGSLALGLFGLLGVNSLGFAGRPAMAMLKDAQHVDSGRCFTGDNMARIERGNLCIFGQSKPTSPDFILWGDSHANALFPVFKKLAEDTETYGVFIGEPGCRPLLRVERRDGNYRCREFNQKVLEYVMRKEIDNVFLVGRWELALGISTYEVSVGVKEFYFTDDQSEQLSIIENQAVLKRELRETVAQLSAAGKRVWIVLSPPEPGVRVPQLIAHGDMEPGDFAATAHNG